MSDDVVRTARLWTADGFVEDRWSRAASLEEARPDHPSILPLAAYLAVSPQTLEMRGDRLAVELLPGEPLEALLPRLGTLPLVALAFPAFNDGRSFSKAQTLVERHGYRGAVRATGDVLIDQIPLMLRTGFTEFEVTNPTAIARLKAGRVGGIANHYQPGARPEPGGARYAWRRSPSD